MSVVDLESHGACGKDNEIGTPNHVVSQVPENMLFATCFSDSLQPLLVTNSLKNHRIWGPVLSKTPAIMVPLFVLDPKPCYLHALTFEQKWLQASVLIVAVLPFLIAQTRFGR